MRALRGFSSSRWLGVLIKEFIQLKRDRLTFGMIVGIPLMQMLLFGYAINFDVRNLRAAVVDEARTSLSREYVAALEASGVVEFAAPSAGVPQLQQRMQAQWLDKYFKDLRTKNGV